MKYVGAQQGHAAATRGERRLVNPSFERFPMSRRAFLVSTACAAAFAGLEQTASGQTRSALSAVGGVRPNISGQTAKPLRYRPDGADFVITDGAEFFNRALYGGNTAFRADGGDKPEFVLYLPGRGGNLRFGLRAGSATRWLHAAQSITTRYRPGELHYEIRDPLLRAGAVRLAAMAHVETEGIIVRAAGEALPDDAELIIAYGGVNGERGARDGDIGTERVPISEYFQFKPDFAQGNSIVLDAEGFRLTSPAATIVGTVTGQTHWEVKDAADWNDLPRLTSRRSRGIPARPIVVARLALSSAAPIYVSLQRIADGSAIAPELDTYREVSRARSTPAPAATLTLPAAYPAAELPAIFDRVTQHFAALRGRVRVETPDAYLNAAVGALNIAADAVWDEPQQAIMHGAIAWRAKLLGWRGPYVLDALGWHERARHNYETWTGRQNLDLIPAALPPAEEDSNLARNETGLHSNGDLSNSHYDMNMVFVDALFRHLLWTGDTDYAREVWPVIKRHLAWERRLFRRTFGADELPLYEAYATIWASDDIQYSGGGTSYASAYNLYHHRMAARLAPLAGEDPHPFEQEADLIARGMRAHLWLADKGAFAEFKDLLGEQCVHPSAGLWSYYHTIDSDVVSQREAWRMAQSIMRDFARIPIHGPGVPDDAEYHVLPTTDWMPYSWSVNNVVMGENLHAALALWKAGRSEEAFVLTKSAILASMYMGIAPGNVGTMNFLDVYRRESQRDFADGAGVMARALVEGLFGIRPDALAGEILINPGFPGAWREARLTHPDIGVRFSRSETEDQWEITQAGARFARLRLRLDAWRDRVRSVTVNGRLTRWRSDPDAVGRPVLEIACDFDAAARVIIQWAGAAAPRSSEERGGDAFVRARRGAFRWWAAVGDDKPRPTQRLQTINWATPIVAADECLDLTPHFNDRVTEIFGPGKYRSPRSPFVSLALPSQGLGAWAGHVHATAEIDDAGLRAASAQNGGRIVLPNGVAFATPGPGRTPNIVFTSRWDNYPNEASVPLTGRARRLFLLMAGTTNHMQSQIDNGEVVVDYTDGSQTRFALHNPTTWWPIEQDYFLDDFQFRNTAPLPPRVDLRTGRVRILENATFKGQGAAVPGGAATVLCVQLAPERILARLNLRALANDVVIGLMAATLER